MKVELKIRKRVQNYYWTEDSVSYAVDEVRRGVSAARVATEMERLWPHFGKPTRNAVIGKVSRELAKTKEKVGNRFVVINGSPHPTSQRIQKINRATANEMDRAPPTAVNLEALPLSDIHQLEDPSKAAARKLGPLADYKTGLPYSVTSIRRGLCHYPIGDPYKPGFGYCGRIAHTRPPCRPGDDGITSYCDAHRLLVYDPKEDGRRDKELKKLARQLPTHLRS
jgi:GcrA cell cycle regulator